MSLFRASSTARSFEIDSFTRVGPLAAGEPASSTRAPMLSDESGGGDFSSVYAAWYIGVVRWAKALGVPSCDKYDVANTDFVIVHRRLPDCDRRNIAGWLYRLTARQVRDYRRQRWNPRYFKGHEPVSHDIRSRAPTPAMSLEAREAHGVLSSFLSGLTPPTRSTFVLFELYGFTCEAIAALHKVSPNTIWGRLRRARQTVLSTEWDAQYCKGTA